MIIFKCYRMLQKWRHFRSVYLMPSHQFGFSSLVAHSCQQHQHPVISPSFPEYDSHVYSRMFQHCIKTHEPTKGKVLHCQIIKRGNCLDLFCRNILLNFYVKMGVLSEAVNLFDEMPERNMVSFVTMVQGYSQLEEYDKALDLFFRLHKEGHELNPFVFTTVLKLLVSMERVELAWCIHACTHKLGHDCNAFVGTALIDAYTVCGFVDVAKEVFNGIVERDMVCWTGMVTCYAENDCYEEALKLFTEMRMEGLFPNNYTFASVIKAW